MRFYLERHKFYCGIDLHAKKMFLCVLDEQVLLSCTAILRRIPNCCGEFCSHSEKAWSSVWNGRSLVLAR